MNDFLTRYGPWALITGASAGIGQAFALELAARGLNIVAVARRQHLLDRLKIEIDTRHRVEVRTLALDLTAPRAVETIDHGTRDIDVGLVIPAAGMAVAGEFIASTPETDDTMARLNMHIPLQLTRLFADRIIARQRSGGVLLVSSLFAYQGVPYFAHYTATKAYILLLGESLNVELKKHNIDVTVLSPGLTATDMPANLPLDFSKLPLPYQSAATVAKAGLRALGRKASVVSGLTNKFFAWQNRLTPRKLPIWLFGFLIKRAFKYQQDPSR